MTPDWMPNIHPLIVHFPVALLTCALLAELTRLFIRKSPWLNRTTVLLYITGTAGLVAAYITGQQAIDSVTIGGAAVSAAAEHEDRALVTTLFFLLFTPFRTVLYWLKFEEIRTLQFTAVLLAGIGGGLLWQTGELGTELVYKHGVAVKGVDHYRNRIGELERELAGLRQEAVPVLRNDGSWNWHIAPGAGEMIRSSFTVEGSATFQATTDRDDQGAYLILTPGFGESHLLFDRTMQNAEGTVELNIDSYSGSIALVHHYQNPDTYQYLKLESGILSQGQIRNGSDQPLANEEVNGTGWFTLRVSASGEHFYGYRNGRTVIHTHADEMEAGRTGFSFRGNGKLLIRSVGFTPLD